MLGHNPLGASQVQTRTGPHMKGRKRLTKRQTPPDWQVAVLTSKGTYKNLSWVTERPVGFLHPPTRILKVYVEALMGFSCTHQPGGLCNTLLPQDCVRGQLLPWGRHSVHAECTFPGHGREWGASVAQVHCTGQLVVTSFSNIILQALIIWKQTWCESYAIYVSFGG